MTSFIWLKVQNHIRQVFSPEVTVTVVKHQSIKPILQEQKALMWLRLCHCVFLNPQNLFALYLLTVILNRVLFEPFNFKNSKSDIVSL